MFAYVTDAESASSLVGTQSLSFIIHPQLNSVMIAHTFLALLLPLVISLFYFSTAQSRRRPIFILNLAAIFLAFVVGVLIDVNSVSLLHPSVIDRQVTDIQVQIHSILEPLNPLPLKVR